MEHGQVLATTKTAIVVATVKTQQGVHGQIVGVTVDIRVEIRVDCRIRHRIIYERSRVGEAIRR